MKKKNLAVATLSAALLAGIASPAAHAGVSIPADYQAPVSTVGAEYNSVAETFVEPTLATQVTNISPVTYSYPSTDTPKASYTNALGSAVQVSTVTGNAARDAVVRSALSQIGNYQDCTMLATNSIKSIGINFHDWPVGYTGLGVTVDRSEAKPGDLIYYERNGFTFADGTPQSHIAVYIGDGMAVHGGWNGMGTEIFSVDLPTATAPIFISLDAYNQ